MDRVSSVSHLKKNSFVTTISIISGQTRDLKDVSSSFSLSFYACIVEVVLLVPTSELSLVPGDTFVFCFWFYSM